VYLNASPASPAPEKYLNTSPAAGEMYRYFSGLIGAGEAWLLLLRLNRILTHIGYGTEYASIHCTSLCVLNIMLSRVIKASGADISHGTEYTFETLTICTIR